MNIPDEAIEAAAKAYIELRSVEVITSPQEYAEAMLEAAHKHIAHQVLSRCCNDLHHG